MPFYTRATLEIHGVIHPAGTTIDDETFNTIGDEMRERLISEGIVIEREPAVAPTVDDSPFPRKRAKRIANSETTEG